MGMRWKGFVGRLLPRGSADADPFFLIFASFLLLTLPLRWLIAAVLAAAFHEFCHLAVVWLIRGKAEKLSIGVGGAVIDAGCLSTGQELICALAGPAGSLSLILVARWIHVTALCALVQGLYNLLPVYPLDGGRALRCFLKLLAGENVAQKLCQAAECVTIGLILLLGIGAAVILKLGFFPLVIAVWMCLRVLGRKIPCKAAQLGVQ